MDSTLSREVQMQYMRPGQLEEAARRFPVVYVPFGCIEWHGRHLPLGNDALKAHGILVKCAEQYGGVVFPEVWFHSGFGRDHMVPVVSQLFERLKKTGFRVIIAVSGHNIPEQIEMLEDALAAVTADGKICGAALWEFSLSKGEDSNSDHAAKWETSNMMFFYPELVRIEELGTGHISFDMKPPWGIDGLDPRIHASAQVGKKNIELASKAIGEKARQLLGSLPESERGFNIGSIEPDHWWMI